MNLSARFNISPSETKRYKLDYTLQLAQGETVTGVVPTISSATDGANTGGCTVSGIAITPDGTQAAFFVSFSNPNTADRQTYNVKFIATTSLTQQWEDVVQYAVKEKTDT